VSFHCVNGTSTVIFVRVQQRFRSALNATFQYPTGGAEAIATARQLLVGESVPKKITLKSRVFTKNSVKQGGEVLL
jgi:hypothetical protein